MGIKMPKTNFNGREIGILEYKEAMKENLVCIYCGVPITYVSGHLRKVGDRNVYIQPYFRLMSKEKPHEKSCEYITANALKNICTRVADADLMTNQNDKYVARLHIVTENTRNIEKKTITQEKESNNSPKMNPRYIPKGKETAYLNAMSQIVRLKESLDNDKELRDLLTLQFYDEYKKMYREIKWKDFYADYSVEQYEHMYDLIKNRKAYHPICFSGEIKEVKEFENQEFYAIKFYSLKKAEGEYLSLSVLTDSRDVFEYANGLVGRRVVVYGYKHSVKEPNTTVKNSKKTVYYNFNTRISVNTQLFPLE